VPTLPTPAPIEVEIARIRELSKAGLHCEALAAAEALVDAVPTSRDALYLIATNLRCLNRLADAMASLQDLERQHPRFSLLYQERGYCFSAQRDVSHAIEAFSQAVNLNPALMTSWIMLERLYRMTGQVQQASKAAEQVAMLNQLPPEVVRAGILFSDGELSATGNILRRYLQNGGNHVQAFRLLARVERQTNELEEAERLLVTALKLEPNYRATRLDYARVLFEQQKYLQVIEVLEDLLAADPGDKDFRSLYAAACAGLGRHERAIDAYRQLLAESPQSHEFYVALAHSLKCIGRREEAVASYKTASDINPSFGDAYWSLANLKTYHFSDDEIAHMRAEESNSGVASIDRYHLCFALGRAYEDRKQYADSWQYYERGNTLKRNESRYRLEYSEINTRQQSEICTAEFFAHRANVGAPDSDPIFIVGLPRSGSTLIEQILASHSQVEGTQELPELARIVRGLEGSQSDPENPRYPAVLAELAAEDFRKLGNGYLNITRAYRGNKPFFIDKMPNNFRHIGLIHLILPNARVIDVCREPMACCFSNLKQLFASGQEFTYSMEDIARYYRTYLDLMRHWDAVLPGRVLRVCYEDVVEHLETNVRRILRFCALEFEPACLEFYKTQRTVATASSEQVRQPIFCDSLLQWRNYERWLRPLKDALGDAVQRYRE